LIVLEGIDGAGKTTQVRLLLERLRREGIEAVSYREPSHSRWGREIKRKAARPGSLSPKEELELFLKDRKENVTRNLKPALKEGKVVVLDRYYFSTMAYQGARGIDPDEIRKRNEAFAVKPDLVIILDLPPAEGLERIEKSRRKKERLFEREDYLVKVREIFLRITGENVYRVDADQSAEKIAREVERIVFAFIGRGDGPPPGPPRDSEESPKPR